MTANLLKYNLIHLLYLPIIFVYSMVIEEGDLGIVGLVMTLSFIICILNYYFNYGLTILGLKVLKNKKWAFIPFLFPTATLVVLFYPISVFINYLDFGGQTLILILITGSAFINVFIFYCFFTSNDPMMK